MKNLKNYVVAIISIILLVALDQYTKHLAVLNLRYKQPYKLIPNVLHFDYVTNDGAAWGILSNKQTLFIVLTIIILLIVAFIYCMTPATKKYLPFKVTLVLLTAGAIGNFIDRVKNGYVHDFISFVLIDFPIFNVADCYVTISAFLLAILVIFVYKEDDDFDFLNLSKRRNDK